MDQLPIKHWYQSFFQNMALEYWFEKTNQPRLIEKETARLLKHLALEEPSSLLDIPCGFGFHAQALAEKGHRITGIDMADACVQHARSLKVPHSDFIKERMESFKPAQETYDGAYCLGNSLGYIAPADTQIFFDHVSKALKPGARFIIHTGMIREALLANITDQAWEKCGSLYFLQEHELNDNDTLLTTACTFLDIANGREEENTLYHYIFSMEDLYTMLENAGLDIVHCFSSDTDTPFEEGDPAVYLVCEKDV